MTRFMFPFPCNRYVCVTLLQPHILTSIVPWFSSRGWPVRVIRCPEAAQDRGLPVFVLVATKFKQNNNMRPVLEFSLSSDGQINRLPDSDSLVASVRGCQQFTALRARLAGGGDKTMAEASLDLSLPGDHRPRYSLFLAERIKARGSTRIATLGIWYTCMYIYVYTKSPPS